MKFSNMTKEKRVYHEIRVNATVDHIDVVLDSSGFSRTGTGHALNKIIAIHAILKLPLTIYFLKDPQ